MDFINAIVLGIVEGLTEFLPVSSTGHLVLASQWFGFSSSAFTNLFNIVIQSGAILAVIIYFRKRLLPIYKIQTLDERKDIGQTWLRTLVGFLPAVVLALVFSDLVQAHLMIPLVVAIALIVWGVVILLIDTPKLAASRSIRFNKVSELTWPVVVGIGLIQCLALVPGTSRSAATIVGALLLGASRMAAAEFSFFLAIPTLIGAGGYALLKELKAGLSLGINEIALLATGLVTSFVVAFAVVAVFMRFIQKHDFRPFGWYRIALGAAVIIFFVVAGGLFQAQNV